MDIRSIINRFVGRNFIVYGGDVDTLSMLKSIGNVMVWYTNKYDEGSSPPQQLYNRFIQNMDNTMKTQSSLSNAIMFIVCNGYVGGMRAELFASKILRSRGYRDGTIIFHGYPKYVDEYSNTNKEVYVGGCIVASRTDTVSTLQDIASVLEPNIVIPVPMVQSYLSSNELNGLLPYIHLSDTIMRDKKITYSTSLPTDIIDIDNTDKHLPYDSDNRSSSLVHWGQRKLLLSEIELLTTIMKHDIDIGSTGKDFIVVYVGAAPGSHITYLLNLFGPKMNLSLHLWDRPSRFDIKDNGTSIRIIPTEYADPDMVDDREGFFTSYVANRYRDIHGTNSKIIFISDIRDSISEDSVDNDMKIQKDWVNIMQPYASQLKFRLPFNSTSYTYLDGYIYTQAWSRPQSTESRLLSYRPYRDRVYNASNYDMAFSYLNTVTRQQSYDLSMMTGLNRYIHDSRDGFCTCHDCAREVQIITNYMKVMGYPITESNMVAFIGRNTIECRPKGDVSNNRTLWDIVNPKMVRADRQIALLYQQLPPDKDTYAIDINTLWKDRTNGKGLPIKLLDTSIDSINMSIIDDLLVYADGYDMNELVDILMKKKDGSIYMDGGVTSMGSVLSGYRPTIVVNFHTDFIQQYDSSKDKGTAGTSIYRQFLQGYKIKDDNDIHKHLILYCLSRL